MRKINIFLSVTLISIGIVVGYYLNILLSKYDTDLVSSGSKGINSSEQGLITSKSYIDKPQSAQYRSSLVDDPQAKKSLPVDVSTVDESSFIGSDITQEFLDKVNDTSFLTFNNPYDEDEVVAAVGVEFLQLIEESPYLLGSFLESYEQLPDNESKRLLRSFLASTNGLIENGLSVEDYALEKIGSSIKEEKMQWLQVLGSTGINDAENREALFVEMNHLSQPELLSQAIQSFNPQKVSITEKQRITDELSLYLDHSDPSVQSAAIETLSKWINKDQSNFIENALDSKSNQLKQAGILATQSSGIQSNTIKNQLLNIVNNSAEDWSLRNNAYSALSLYSLRGQDYEDYYQFYLEKQATDKSSM